MSREAHVRFREKLRVRFPWLTRLVFTFSHQDDAKRFFAVLPKRLNKFGLELHMDKSQLIPAGHLHAVKAKENREQLPTFNFLGFTCYWGKTKNGYWCLKYTSRRDRFTSKLKAMREFLWKNLNAKDAKALLTFVIAGIKGWINYHAVSDNDRRVNQFIHISRRIIFRWFNRRGGNKKMTWKVYEKILEAIEFPVSWKTVSMYSSR